MSRLQILAVPALGSALSLGRSGRSPCLESTRLLVILGEGTARRIAPVGKWDDVACPLAAPAARCAESAGGRCGGLLCRIRRNRSSAQAQPLRAVPRIARVSPARRPRIAVRCPRVVARRPWLVSGTKVPPPPLFFERITAGGAAVPDARREPCERDGPSADGAGSHAGRRPAATDGTDHLCAGAPLLSWRPRLGLGWPLACAGTPRSWRKTTIICCSKGPIRPCTPPSVPAFSVLPVHHDDGKSAFRMAPHEMADYRHFLPREGNFVTLCLKGGSSKGD